MQVLYDLPHGNSSASSYPTLELSLPSFRSSQVSCSVLSYNLWSCCSLCLKPCLILLPSHYPSWTCLGKPYLSFKNKLAITSKMKTSLTPRWDQVPSLSYVLRITLYLGCLYRYRYFLYLYKIHYFHNLLLIEL